jgi:hypothetical protein
VTRRSKPTFSFAAKRIERLRATPEFQGIATSGKEPGKERNEEIRIGKQIQENILVLLSDMDGTRVYHNRDEFRRQLGFLFKGFIMFPDHFWNLMMDALSDEDE